MSRKTKKELMDRFSHQAPGSTKELQAKPFRPDVGTLGHVVLGERTKASVEIQQALDDIWWNAVGNPTDFQKRMVEILRDIVADAYKDHTSDKDVTVNVDHTEEQMRVVNRIREKLYENYQNSKYEEALAAQGNVELPELVASGEVLNQIGETDKFDNRLIYRVNKNGVEVV